MSDTAVRADRRPRRLAAGVLLAGALLTASAPVAHADARPADVRDKIVEAAKAEIGTEESGGDNCQKYSEQCVAWCSLFATWAWEKAGVDIDNEDYAFTGDVYTHGQDEDKAYNAKNLDQAQPGDVLLFGSGPESPDTSTHIGVVEKVSGDEVTLIEGNAGDNTDRVVRRTHTLSAETFYGGVQPW